MMKINMAPTEDKETENVPVVSAINFQCKYCTVKNIEHLVINYLRNQTVNLNHQVVHL